MSAPRIGPFRSHLRTNLRDLALLLEIFGKELSGGGPDTRSPQPQANDFFNPLTIPEQLARFAHHRTCRRRLKASAGGVGGFEAVGGVPGRPGPPESGATEPGNADSGLGSRWMAGAGQTASVAPVAARAAGGGRTAAGGVSRAPRGPAARAGRRARARTAPAAGSRTETRPGSCGR